MNPPSVHARHRVPSSVAILSAIVLTLAVATPVAATPAPGPTAVSRTTPGALTAGVIPDGTCRARVTAAGGGGASAPTAAGFGGTGGAGAVIDATFEVLPGQTYAGSVGGGGGNPAGGSGNGATGTGGTGGTIVNNHRGGGGGGRSTVALGGSTVLVAGGGGGGGGAHQVAPAGVGGGGGISGIAAGVVAAGSDGQNGYDGASITAGGGQGGQAAAGGAGGVNSNQAARNGAAGGGTATGTGGNGGPDANYDSGGGGGGGYTGGGGGAATVTQSVTGAGGGGGSSWVAAGSPVVGAPAPTSIAGAAGTASPVGTGAGASGSVAIDWLPCLYTLSIDKSVATSPVNAGDSVVWTVSVTNTGPDPMTRGDTVDLADTLPGPTGTPTPAFRVLSISTTGGSNASLSRGAVTCTGVSVGSTMPTSTVCSRPYSATSAPEAPSGGTRGLDPGETLTIAYEQIVPNAAACSTITNTATTTDRATQSGTTDMVGVSATRTADESLTIDCYDLAVAKSVSPTSARAGGDLTWTITVTNLGPGDMEGPVDTTSNPLVVSDVAPTSGVGAPTGFTSTGPADGAGTCTYGGGTITCPSGLPAGGVQVFTFDQAVAAGVTSGATIDNTATVSDPTTGDTNDSASATATVAGPDLALDKSASPSTYDAVGDVIGYSYVVTNIGGVRLADPVTVTDDQVGVTCPLTSTVGNGDGFLDPDETLTCTASATIDGADLDAGSLTNVASAHADGIDSPTDTETVTADVAPALSIDKSASPSTYDAVGDVIAYSYVVTNTGNVTLAGPVTVSDDQVDVSCPTVTSLAPGDSVTCTASATIDEDDLAAGSLTNVAAAHADGIDSPSDTVTVTSDAVPTPTPTPTGTAEPTATATAEPTGTATPTPSASASVEPTATTDDGSADPTAVQVTPPWTDMRELPAASGGADRSGMLAALGILGTIWALTMLPLVRRRRTNGTG